MFAAPESGSGKTLITCAFLELLKRRRIKTVSFKCGPDYIDPLFHSMITGRSSVNLDSFFLERAGLNSLFRRKMEECSDIGDGYADGPVAVIEGVMGYYDGIAGTSFKASSYDIADALQCPVILILDVKKEGLSTEKELGEFIDRVPQSHIRGVILNRAGKEDAVEFSSRFGRRGIKIYGYIPECDEAMVGSRHLGLRLPSEIEKFQEKISAFSDIIEKTTDVDGIIKLSMQAEELPGAESERDPESMEEPPADRGVIAVARDEAFCFIYEDNIDFLKELGYEVRFFSPLRDKALPADASALYLGGGYPELCADRLSANKEMLQAVREAFGRIKIMAECGGFLYLHESLEGMDGRIYPMAGCISGKAFRTDRSSRFGYIYLCPLGSGTEDPENGEERYLIKAHEFHYWDSTAPGGDLTARKPLSGRSWDCCFCSPFLLAGFPHLYYRSGPGFIRSFLDGEDY